MLSRIAESLFWIGRYVERAEGTSRILEVETQLILEDPSVDEVESCRAVLAIMGVPAAPGENVDVVEMVSRLALDPESPTSIAACFVAARESARRARETTSTALWEAINMTYRAIPDGRFTNNPRLFAWVRDRAALINGTADSTMMRDEGWQFLVLGRSIERADMTARLLAAASVSGGEAWMTTLRTCGGYEAFLRAHNGNLSPSTAAGFLLVDRLFPRSVLAALVRAEDCLAALDEGASSRVDNEPQRLLGRLRADLEYRRLDDILSELPIEMDRLQRSCVDATNAISAKYFAGAEVPHWRGRPFLEAH